MLMHLSIARDRSAAHRNPIPDGDISGQTNTNETKQPNC
jgi:hypothetical protein